MKLLSIIFLFFTFFLAFSLSFGQAQNLILTFDQNNKWLETLKTLPLNQQLATIKERLLADTGVFVRQIYPDRIKVVEQLGNRVYGDGKPLIIIEGFFMAIDNKTEPKKIIRLSLLLDTINIKTMLSYCSEDRDILALYGASAQSGLIIMTLTRKKYLKKFKRIKLTPN